MDLDFERLLIISMLVAVIGGVTGGVSSAMLEHRLFGQADKAGAFRTRRTAAQLIAVAIGTAVGYALVDGSKQVLGTSDLVSLILGVAAGVVAHYVVHAATYAFLIKTR